MGNVIITEVLAGLLDVICIPAVMCQHSGLLGGETDNGGMGVRCRDGNPYSKIW